MIKTIRHKGLLQLYETGTHKGVNPDHARRLETILNVLDVAVDIADIRLPSFRLHQLTGDMKGLWSITVRANWRIVFRFVDGDVFDVDLIDYH